METLFWHGSDVAKQKKENIQTGGKTSLSFLILYTANKQEIKRK